MTLEELTQVTASYEMEQPVHEYRCYDWNVWPLLRTTILNRAWDSVQHQDYRADKVSGAKRAWTGFKKLAVAAPFAGDAALYAGRLLAMRRARKACRALQDLDPEQSECVVAGGRDVVVLASSQRRQWLEGSLYEIYSDPLVETLQGLGLSTLVWERGEERWPRTRPSAWISRLLTLECLKLSPLPVLPEPPWFHELQSFARAVTGKALAWSEVEPIIRQVQQASRVFQDWLEKAGARHLVVIGWYGREVTGALLAARRLGVTSVDLQHGIQFSGHYGYAGWVKAPAGGFEGVPDVFWCWGSEPAGRLLRENPVFQRHSRIVIGGNLWLNKWRSGEAASPQETRDALERATAGRKKVITVTLQPLADFNELIAEAISVAPEEWLWFLRFHPETSDTEKSHVQELVAGSAASVVFQLANEAPFFSLLRVSDAHVTGLSTCAHEALAFDVPSVITAREGRDIFRRHLDRGVMLYAANAGEVVSMVRKCEGIAKGACLDASYELFASPEQSHSGIQSFLARRPGSAPGPSGKAG